MYAGLSARMSNLLMLHKPLSVQGSFVVDREHRKRVWWTSYCLDRMTSTEMGLSPAFQFDDVELDYPTDEILSPEDSMEFYEVDYLTARIQITFIKADIDTSVPRLRKDNTADVETMLGPILLKLESWKTGLPGHMSFDVQNGMPENMKQMASMRSLASLYLRYNQVCESSLYRKILLRIF